MMLLGLPQELALREQPCLIGIEIDHGDQLGRAVVG